jgi:hypothetical protein
MLSVLRAVITRTQAHDTVQEKSDFTTKHVALCSSVAAEEEVKVYKLIDGM